MRSIPSGYDQPEGRVPLGASRFEENRLARAQPLPTFSAGAVGHCRAGRKPALFELDQSVKPVTPRLAGILGGPAEIPLEVAEAPIELEP
jgi:hypothetical protein